MTADHGVAPDRLADPVVRMRGIRKEYPGVVALKGVDFEVARGEVHALLGENGAGKTTLMKVLYGLVTPDAGSIEVGGTEKVMSSPREALKRGVGMVHQHFMLVPNMTVAENIALGMHGRLNLMAPMNLVVQRVEELVDRFGFVIDLEEEVENLSVGARQTVEILKVLVHGASTLVLDEPTASLTPQQWSRLVAVLRLLVQDGASVVLITHKLDELDDIADRCTVLRDGAVVGSAPMGDTDKASLARMMVGRTVTLRVEVDPQEPGTTLLDVRNLSMDDALGRRRLAGVSLQVREREILGVAGVDGNGQAELADVLSGVQSCDAGEIRMFGEPIQRLGVREFNSRGGATVPEDRHRDAVALDLPLQDNLIMKTFDQPPLSRLGFLVRSVAEDRSRQLLDEYAIRAPSSQVLMRQLSGGNQQKSVIARELDRSPRVLIASQPTRGLDVGAMEFVYEQILKHRRNGGATLLLSNELDEILSLSDRIAVIVRGSIVATIDARDVDVEQLGLLMSGEQIDA